jgi:two-component system response regulator FixJ
MTPEKHFKVAMVDDDPGLRDALRWLLSSNGYDVHCYGDADSFIETHDLTALGCSLIDLRLGTEDGLEVFRRARASGHDAPVIMISAYGSIPTAVRALQLGALEFIEKPFDNENLLRVVADACRRHTEICKAHGRAIEAIRRFRLLTDREAEVYWLLGSGAATKEIALQLKISTRTAETHRGRVFDKFEARCLEDVVRTHFHIKPLFNPSL